MLFQIQGTTLTEWTDPDGNVWTTVRQTPTFFVDSSVQGFFTLDGSGAAMIAADVIGGDSPAVVSVTPADLSFPTETHWVNGATKEMFQ